MFAQEGVKVEEVARELEEARRAAGSGADVARFTKEALLGYGAAIGENGGVRIDLSEVPRAVKEAVGTDGTIRVRFELPVEDGELYLSRTHPIVEGLATHVLDSALDPLEENPIARRCGVTVTSRVERRTTLLLVRFRFHIISRRGADERELLAEDCQLLAFAGSPAEPRWLDREAAEELLQAEPEGNISPDRARHFLGQVIAGREGLEEHLARAAGERGEELLESHRRVRRITQQKGVRYAVEPKLPPDLLGIYIYLPKRG